jgi:hypothetical protein
MEHHSVAQDKLGYLTSKTIVVDEFDPGYAK